LQARLLCPFWSKAEAARSRLPGHQHRAEATARSGLELPHELANRLHLARARAVCVHTLHRQHGLMQRLRQIKPGQLGCGQDDKLDPERL
jgi:hypothetical protein